MSAKSRFDPCWGRGWWSSRRNRLLCYNSGMTNDDPNTFTQKDLMQHLLHATQHAATREELQLVKQEIVADIDKRFEQVDKRFEQVDKRFEQVDKRFDELKGEIKEQGKRHDRLSWAIFAGMLAIFFKDHLAGIFV